MFKQTWITGGDLKKKLGLPKKIQSTELKKKNIIAIRHPFKLNSLSQMLCDEELIHSSGLSSQNKPKI